MCKSELKRRCTQTPLAMAEELAKVVAQRDEALEALKEADGWLEYMPLSLLPDAQHKEAYDKFLWRVESILQQKRG